MADTERTRAALLGLFADNIVGAISEQDLRDFAVTVMPAEFANPGDFWKQPDAAQLTTDKSYRGWIAYSQVAQSACSFGDVLMYDASGWRAACVSGSANNNALLGLALGSYAAASDQCMILRKGLILLGALSARGMTSTNFGHAVYLMSGVSQGQYSVTVPTVSRVIGYVEPAPSGYFGGYLRFDPSIITVG